MPRKSRKELDEAIQQEQTSRTAEYDAAKNRDDLLLQQIATLQEQVEALKDKVENPDEQNYSAEINMLQQSHATVLATATAPLVTDPAQVGQANPNQGAAGHVIVNQDANAAILAAGGEAPEEGSKAGSATIPNLTKPEEAPKPAEAEEETKTEEEEPTE